MRVGLGIVLGRIVDGADGSGLSSKYVDHHIIPVDFKPQEGFRRAPVGATLAHFEPTAVKSNAWC